MNYDFCIFKVMSLLLDTYCDLHFIVYNDKCFGSMVFRPKSKLNGMGWTVWKHFDKCYNSICLIDIFLNGMYFSIGRMLINIDLSTKWFRIRHAIEPKSAVLAGAYHFVLDH